MTCLTWTWDSARFNRLNSVLLEAHCMCKLRSAIQSPAVTLFAKARHGHVGGSGALAWAWHLAFRSRGFCKDPSLRLTVCLGRHGMEITSC